MPKSDESILECEVCHDKFPLVNEGGGSSFVLIGGFGEHRKRVCHACNKKQTAGKPRAKGWCSL